MQSATLSVLDPTASTFGMRVVVTSLEMTAVSPTASTFVLLTSLGLSRLYPMASDFGRYLLLWLRSL